MKKIVLLAFTILSSFLLKAQCTETDVTKILLIGDSWAFFMNVDGTINDVAKDWGHSNVKYYTNLILSENGAETDDFLKPEKVTEMTNRLTTMPDLKAVHLSIAGNDFLGSWDVHYTQAQTDSLYDGVVGRLDSIIDIISQIRPDIQIFWSGYVYTNFQEVLETTPSYLQTSHPFYGRWQAMGFPTISEINTVQNWFQDKVAQHYSSNPKVTYVHAPGLMQYVFGQTSNLGVAPGGTYAAFTAPMPYGYTDYPSPKNTMRDYGITKDCFHLSASGYRAFISYHFQKFYQKYLMDDAYTIAGDVNSGSVSSNGTTYTELKVGKDGINEFAGIIDLDNTHIADTSVGNVSLFLKIEEITNTNFLSSGEFIVEIANEKFGNSSSLESEDYSNAASASGNACVFGNATAGKWVRLELPASFTDQIRRTKAQIRIRYTGQGDGIIRFANSSDADFQPVLNIKYGDILATASVNTISLDVYPNPAKDLLNISAEQNIEAVSIYNVAGQLMLTENNPSKEISIRSLPDGMYILNVQVGNTVQKVKFIKQ
ncbi:MAG: T9SS type A sorting domain-containing protein [Flavobacteriia bacterium]|nr:T9SS type A sorting domain-containing protein [Flavobacteriia bacterium]OJX36231.1 MAG: hypothetical protein BGO87_07155 [Flavobacteriia bacterium 40-80]